LLQIQLTRPREMGRTVRFYLICVCLVHAQSLLRHLFYPFQYDSCGVLLDFVGRAYPPAHIHVISLDILIFILQVIIVIIAHETGSEVDPDMPDPIGYKSSFADDSDEDEESSHKQHYHEPIFHVRLRSTWQNIIYPPAPRLPDLPLPGATQRPLGSMRFGRLLITVQQRMREQAMAMAQSSGNNGGTISGGAPGSSIPRRNENEPPGAMPPER